MVAPTNQLRCWTHKPLWLRTFTRVCTCTPQWKRGFLPPRGTLPLLGGHWLARPERFGKSPSTRRCVTSKECALPFKKPLRQCGLFLSRTSPGDVKKHHSSKTNRTQVVKNEIVKYVKTYGATFVVLELFLCNRKFVYDRPKKKVQFGAVDHWSSLLTY